MRLTLPGAGGTLRTIKTLIQGGEHGGKAHSDAAPGIGHQLAGVAGILVFGDPLPGSTLGIVLQGLAFLLVIVASAMTPVPRAAAPAAAAA